MTDTAIAQAAATASPPVPDPLTMTERAIRLLSEDSGRPTVATALALMEQVRDFLLSQRNEAKP